MTASDPGAVTRHRRENGQGGTVDQVPHRSTTAPKVSRNAVVGVDAIERPAVVTEIIPFRLPGEARRRLLALLLFVMIPDAGNQPGSKPQAPGSSARISTPCPGQGCCLAVRGAGMPLTFSGEVGLVGGSLFAADTVAATNFLELADVAAVIPANGGRVPDSLSLPAYDAVGIAGDISSAGKRSCPELLTAAAPARTTTTNRPTAGGEC